MSNADRVLMSYVAESTFGTTPNSALNELRMTGESLGQDTTTVNSAEIRDDRQIAEVIRSDIGVSGDINLELSYGTYDDLMQYALYSAGWSTSNDAIASSTDLTFAANTITLGAGSWSNTPAVGSWIKISGATDNAANNGYFKVTAATSTVITVEQTFSDTGSESGSTTINIGSQIANGVNQTSVSFERRYADLSNTYEAFVGCVLNALNLSLTTGAAMTGSFGIMGKSASSETSTIGNGTYNEPTSGTPNQILNTIDHITRLDENGSTLGATAFSIALNNNVRARPQLASLGPVSMGEGAVELTGTLQAYFATAALFNKYLNFTSTSLAVVLSDTAGNAYVIDLPNVRFTSGRRVAGSTNSDVIADLAFTATRDATEDVTIRIVRFPA